MTQFVSWSRSSYVYESGNIQPTSAEDLIIAIANEAQTHTFVLDPLTATLGVSAVYVKYVGQTFYRDTGLVFDITDPDTYILTVERKISSVKLVTSVNFNAEITLRFSGIPDLVPVDVDVDALQNDIDLLDTLTVGATVIDLSGVPNGGTYTVVQDDISGVMIFGNIGLNTDKRVIFPKSLTYPVHVILYPYALAYEENLGIWYDAVVGDPKVRLYGGIIAAHLVVPSFDALLDIESYVYATKSHIDYGSGRTYNYEIGAAEAAAGAISFGEYYTLDPYRQEMEYANNIKVSNTGAHVLASDPMTMVMFDMEPRIWKITNNIANDIEFYGDDLGNAPIIIPSGQTGTFYVENGEVIRTRKQSIRKVTSADSVARFDQVILADGTFNITLYDANTFLEEVTISNVGAGAITIVCSGTDEILNGTTATTEVIGTGESRRLVVDKSGATKYWIMI